MSTLEIRWCSRVKLDEICAECPLAVAVYPTASHGWVLEVSMPDTTRVSVEFRSQHSIAFEVSEDPCGAGLLPNSVAADRRWSRTRVRRRRPRPGMREAVESLLAEWPASTHLENESPDSWYLGISEDSGRHFQCYFSGAATIATRLDGPRRDVEASPYRRTGKLSEILRRLPNGSRSDADIQAQIREERDSWDD